ncbi:MAG: EamA family transporter [Propionibacteriaceae bacterium]
MTDEPGTAAADNPDVSPVGGAAAPRWHGINPVWLVLAAIASVQVGAAFAKGLFDTVSPWTAAFLRVAFATVMFTLAARPRLRGRTWADWRPVIGYGLCLAGMNVAIYLSFARIPIGLAVTLEFLGPLALAVIGSRRLVDYAWVLLAGLGVALLGAFPVGADLLGIGLALLAGAMWAGYIALAGPTGERWEGITGVTVASFIGMILLAPPGLAMAGSALFNPTVLGITALVGLLSSFVPYALEMQARRTISSATFGILMSLEPAAAALAALVVLGEKLQPVEWAAMACVVIASVGATRTARTAPID